MASLRLAVVVVSYNTRDLLRACLRSVFDYAGGLPLDVVVVDNAGRDGSAGMVAAEFPQAHLFALDANLGFTGGNNLALRALGLLPGAGERLPVPPPDYVLLLNPDAELTPGALARLAAFMQATPAAGACGPRLAYGDGSFQHGAFRFPTLAQVALDLLPAPPVPGAARVHVRLANSALNGRYPAALWQGGQPFPVDFVLGAAMLVRAAAIRQVGGLDEGYFMYCEEMDWCVRLQVAGWGVYAVPDALVVHHEGQSSRQVRWPAFERLWRSRYRFYGLHRDLYPRGYVPAVRVLVRGALALRRRAALRRFARGRAGGVEAGAEVRAYDAVMGL